jgi:hypothetical protein
MFRVRMKCLAAIPYEAQELPSINTAILVSTPTAATTLGRDRVPGSDTFRHRERWNSPPSSGEFRQQKATKITGGASDANRLKCRCFAIIFTNIGAFVLPIFARLWLLRRGDG